MSTLGELLAEHTVLPGSAVDHLHTLVGEWQLLADLAFADYLMWVRRDPDPAGALICVAQCRPNTAPTGLLTDAVGTVEPPERLPLVAAALTGGRIAGDAAGQAVPVRHGGAVVAVLSRVIAPAERAPGPYASRLESAYTDCARDLERMLADGTFPGPGDAVISQSSPRVGDGFIRLDPAGAVDYASPNARSVYHRMGRAAELAGHDLVEITGPLVSDPFEARELAEHLRAALSGGAGTRFEVAAAGAVVLWRTLPLVVAGVPAGAVVLVRDVTEIKRRDRALLSKDATIREIHHRVKNNLQTVAALLRMQARRTVSPEGRTALLESVRRVSSIAMVHEALSMSVDEVVSLDEVIDRILPIMNDVANVDRPVQIQRSGVLGALDAGRATALVMVLTELVQNALEHAFDPGAVRRRVTIRAERSARWLDVVVHDDGHGLPDGFSLAGSDRLGLQIVNTLVSTELDGTLSAREAPGGGTDMVLRIPAGGRRTRPAH